MAAKLETKISQINPQLYAGQKTFPNGQDTYFYFEEIDDANIGFWTVYQRRSESVAKYLNAFCKSLVSPQLSKREFETDYSDEETEKIKHFVQKKGWYKDPFDIERSPLSGVGGGAAGMSGKVFPSSDQTKRYMVYVSRKPVQEKHAAREYALACEVDGLKKYREKFGHIVMSTVFIADVDTPATTHFGIFRNPLDFLDIDEKYRGISMPLHGFAAAVALQFFKNKVYMITEPMPSMAQIMHKSLEKGAIHLGTNRNLNTEGKNSDSTDDDQIKLMKEYPPILHLTCNGVVKIAKEGIDLAAYPDELPDDLAEFIEQPGQRFDHSSWTIGALKTVIQLDHLAKTFFS